MKVPGIRLWKIPVAAGGGDGSFFNQEWLDLAVEPRRSEHLCDREGLEGFVAEKHPLVHLTGIELNLDFVGGSA